MKRKPVQIDIATHRKIQMEAFHQSGKSDYVVTMGAVVAQLATKLGKRRKK